LTQAHAQTIVEPAARRTKEQEMTTTVSPTERATATAASISEREAREIEAANASGNTPVVFIHGLWLLPSSWANWADFFGCRRGNGRYYARTVGFPSQLEAYHLELLALADGSNEHGAWPAEAHRNFVSLAPEGT
jgi:hypothetical protein